ncbi:MAG: hypothetical protein KJ666_00460 [Bacteroidetes bacterium]|nr:hypothetical protein [Bacteroidota bacterium]
MFENFGVICKTPIRAFRIEPSLLPVALAIFYEVITIKPSLPVYRPKRSEVGLTVNALFLLRSLPNLLNVADIPIDFFIIEP